MTTYLMWLLPPVVIAVAIASGRLNTTFAALLGLIVAIPVASLTGPAPFAGSNLLQALARGLWIGSTIAPYIVGGLLFWQVAIREASPGALGALPAGSRHPVDGPESMRARRRLLFFACFLIGPFAESATGFGVGMLGTVALLRNFKLAPHQLMVFALLSQTLIPWGAMGSGTMLAAAYARIPAADLGLYATIPVALLMLIWLPLFWRTARQAQMPASFAECAGEACWMVSGLALLAVATACLGPETALLAAFGPLIVLRYIRDTQPDRPQLIATTRRVLPFMALIGGLVLTRLVPGLKESLTTLGKVAPFGDLPAWSPLFHAGSWLIVGSILTSAWRGHAQRLPLELHCAWATGKNAVLTVFLFAMMAEVLSMAGISQAFAEGMFTTLNAGAVLLTPLVAGAFGILANSGNAPNSLFMPSQVALAVQAGLSIPAIAALLHVSGTSMSLFSPVRMSIAASLATATGQERKAYGVVLPYAIAGFALLMLMAIGVVLAR
ncbi:hypothetical protein D3C81_569220 [compost metagenome]